MAQKVETTLNQQKRSVPNMVTMQGMAVGSQVVPYSEVRTALIMCSDPTTAYVVSLDRNAPAGLGFRVPAGGLPFMVSMELYGAVVFGPLYIVSATPPATIVYCETINTAP